jgi:adenosylcobinamide-GDP ribazoletransferase
MMRSFLVAVGFLTVVPVRFREPPADRDVARSRWWFPVVAVLLGLGLAGGTRALLLVGSPPLAAFLVLLAWVIVTGALHLDGFCDLCDGLFAGPTRADRLRIMKDPHLGAFGLAGGGLLLLGKFVALQELLAYWPGGTPALVGTAVVAARCGMLWMATRARYPRTEGTGKLFIGTAPWWEGLLYLAAATAAVGWLVPLTGARSAVVLLATLVAVWVGLLLVCQRRLGGLTGDCLGAAVEAAELAFLFAAALLRAAAWS